MKTKARLETRKRSEYAGRLGSGKILTAEVIRNVLIEDGAVEEQLDPDYQHNIWMNGGSAITAVPLEGTYEEILGKAYSRVDVIHQQVWTEKTQHYQDVKMGVIHTLRTWDRHVKHEVAPGLRVGYAPTSERIARRTGFTVEDVRKFLDEINQAELH